MSSKLKYLLFLIIPTVLYLVILKLRAVWGAYYFIPNSDPAYLFLINSMDVATLQQVCHVDNPGTTVQVLGGIVIRIIALFKGVTDIETNVLQNPEYYLTAINKVLFSMNMFAVAILGIASFHLTKNILMSLMLQCAPFGSWLLIKAMLMVGPEPMLVFTTIVFTILILWASERAAHIKKPGLFTFLFSIVTAWGIATKLIFIPFILIPLVILQGYKLKTMYLLLTIFLFHVFLIPALAHYDFLLAWVKTLVFHSRTYGQGKPQLIEMGYTFVNLLKLLALDHTFYLAVCVSVLMLLFIFLNKNVRKDLSNNYLVKILLGLTLAVILQLLLTTKQYSPRYTIPSLTLFTTLIYLNIKVLKMIHSKYHFPIKISKVIFIKASLIIAVLSAFYIRHHLGYVPGDTYLEWVKRVNANDVSVFNIGEWIKDILFTSLPFLLSCIFLSLIVFAIIVYYTKLPARKMNSVLTVCLIIVVILYHVRQIDIGGFYNRCANSKNEAFAVIRFLQKEYKGYTKIYGFKSSSKYYALKFGTIFNFSKQHQLNKLKELYSDKIYFWGLRGGGNSFENWTDQTILSEILKEDGNVILQGDKNGLNEVSIRQIESSNHVELVNIFQGNSELIFLVKKCL